MKRYEYDITIHETHAFQQLVYFCSGSGECAPERVPDQQVEKLRNILDAQGHDGWDLVQLVFDQRGIVAFWKRELG